MAESERRHANTVSGNARVYGPTVQGRDIHGGIHFHGLAVPTAPEPPPPRQLPPVPSSFVGRDGDLAALDRLAEDADRDRAAQPLIVVTGPAGVGKTSLVAKWLRDLGPRYPGGQLYADLRGHASAAPAPPAEALARFLRGLGAPSVPADPAEQAALWRTYAAGRRIAVMLDNVMTAAQVRTLLPGDPLSLVVVTSRRSLTGLAMDGGRFHRLAPFSGEQSIALLARVVGHERVAGEHDSAARIAALCAGLPLAVSLASARLAARPAQPLAVLAAALTDESRRLAALDVEGEEGVSHALNASYAVLSADAMTLYRRLGRLPVRVFDPYVAAAACGRPLDWGRRHLDELRDANLVEDLGPESVRLPESTRFHDLVRAHARETAEAEADARGVYGDRGDLGARDGELAGGPGGGAGPGTRDGELGGRDRPDRPDDPGGQEPSREETLRRVCDLYLHLATAAQARITPAQYTLPRTYAYPPGLTAPFGTDSEALSWLDDHRDDLMTVIECASDHRWHTTVWQLVDAMWPLFLRLRHYDLWIRAHTLGLAGARGARDADAERQMLNSGAIGLSAAGRLDEAERWYAQSLNAARAAGDVRDEGQALHGLGTCAQQAGDLARAAAHLTSAVRTWQRCGYARGVALSRIVLGEVALAQDDPAEAAALFTSAHETLVAVDDPHDATRALAFLGSARCRAGEHDAGRELLETALATFTASAAAHWQARTLEMLAECAHRQGDPSAAADFRARAVALYEATSPRDALRLSTAAGITPPAGDGTEQARRTEP